MLSLSSILPLSCSADAEISQTFLCSSDWTPVGVWGTHLCLWSMMRDKRDSDESIVWGLVIPVVWSSST